MPSLPDIPVGDIVDGKYRIVTKVGEGGFGAVYRVRDATANMEYALKIEDVNVSCLRMRTVHCRRKHKCCEWKSACSPPSHK